VGVQAIQVVIISLFLFMVTGCGQRLRRLESNQIVVEKKVDGNTNRIETLTYKMEESQNRLQASIEEVKRSNEITLAEAIATRYEQRKLREASEANDDMIRSGVSQVGARQQILKQSIGQVDSRAKEIGADVEALASAQAGFRKRISRDHKRFAADFGVVQENQEKTHGLSVEGLTIAEAIAHGVKGVQQGQRALSRTVKANDRQHTAQIKGVAQKQKEMHETLSDTYGVSLAIATNVGQVQNNQKSMHQAFQARADSLDEKVTGVQRGQRAVVSGIKKNRELGRSIATDVDHVQGRQVKLRKLVQARTGALGKKVKDVQRDQRALASGIKKNHELGRSIAADVDQVQGRQGQLHELIQARTDSLDEKVTGVQRDQRALSLGIKKNHELGRSIVADVDQMQGQQGQLHELIQARTDVLDEKVADVQRKQGGLASGIEKNSELGRSIVVDVDQVQGRQGQLHELIQARTDSLDEKVTGVQRRQDALASGIQKNHAVGHSIVMDVNQVQDQQVVLRDLIRSEAEVLNSVLAEIANRQNSVAVGLQDNLEVVNYIKGDLSQGQVKRVGGRMKTVEASVAALDNTVSASAANLESHLAALSAAMSNDQQGRTKVDASAAEALASLAQALEQIKVNQMLLRRRLELTRDDARRYNEQFRRTLEQLKKEGREVKAAPKPRPTPVKDDVESEK